MCILAQNSPDTSLLVPNATIHKRNPRVRSSEGVLRTEDRSLPDRLSCFLFWRGQLTSNIQCEDLMLSCLLYKLFQIFQSLYQRVSNLSLPVVDCWPNPMDSRTTRWSQISSRLTSASSLDQDQRTRCFQRGTTLGDSLRYSDWGDAILLDVPEAKHIFMLQESLKCPQNVLANLPAVTIATSFNYCL